MKEILLVEQDRGLSDGIVLGLVQGPYRVTQSFSIKDALQSIKYKTFSLIIMAWKLPDGRGRELLEQIHRTRKTPVIVLTEKGMEPEGLTKLTWERDVWLAKPFSLSQLKELIDIMWKKQKRRPERERRFKSISYQIDREKVFRDTEEVRLSSTERKLLKVLVENEGTPLSASLLANRIWSSSNKAADDRLADAILSLRNKLEEDPQRPEMIHTVWGKGYMFHPVHRITGCIESSPA